VDGDITFEVAGLRVHFGSRSLLIEWRNITGIETLGPAHYQMLAVTVRDRARVVDSALPRTGRFPHDVASLMVGSGIGGTLLLEPWLGGLDAATLARAMTRVLPGGLSKD
jgi:hypothetical protein